MIGLLHDWGWVVAVAVFVLLLLWATKDLGNTKTCPDCGRNLDKYPHHHRCRYMRK